MNFRKLIYAIGVVWMSCAVAKAQNVDSVSSSQHGQLPIYPVRAINDSAQSIISFEPTPAIYGGTIVYAFRGMVAHSPEMHDELERDTVVTISVRTIYGGREHFSYCYPFGMDTKAITISPDHRYLTFSSGDHLDETGGTTVFLWDWRRNKSIIIQGPLDKCYSVPMWSPDSQYFFCMSGGLTRGPIHPQLGVTPGCYDVLHGQFIPTPMLGILGWTKKGELLAQRDLNVDNGLNQESEIDKVSVPTMKSTSLVNNAQSPAVESPDGKWLACQAKPEDSVGASQYGLCLYSEDDKKRYMIPYPFAIPEFVWTNDSKRVLLIAGYKIWILEVATKSIKVVPVQRPESDADSFSVCTLGLIGNNNLLESSVHGALIHVESIDLTTGKVTTLAELKCKALVWVPPAVETGTRIRNP